MNVSNSMTPAERRLRASAAGLTRWANETDRAGAIRPLREGFIRKLEREIDPDGSLPPDELAKRVELARRAHLAKASLAAAVARRKRAAAQVTGVSPAGTLPADEPNDPES